MFEVGPAQSSKKREERTFGVEPTFELPHNETDSLVHKLALSKLV